jgi:hypothetical protein
MYEGDYYEQEDILVNNKNELDKIFEESNKVDKGHNVINVQIQKKDGTYKNKKIDVYTSGETGTRIRDAESGIYYPKIVGSKDEDLFYKVSWATGECNSSNGSSKMFFISPQHFMNHTFNNLSDEAVYAWELKRNARLNEIEKSKRPTN